MSVRQRLAELLQQAPPEAQAVEFEGGWWSWGDLARTADELGSVLDSLPAGTRVGVVLENRPEHVAAVTGLLARGHCLVTLSPLQPAERLAADVARSTPPILIGSPEVLARAGVLTAAIGQVIELGHDGVLRTVAGAVPDGAATSEGVAIEMLTSGTTGPPKRVQLTDRQLDTAMMSSGQLPREGKLLTTGIGLVSTPMVHIGGLWGALAAMHAGRRFVLQPRFTLDGWVSAVERHHIRAAGLVPAAMRTVLDAEIAPERLASLQVVTSGTTACPPELAQAFFETYGIRVLMTYGATEFAGAVAGWTRPLHEQWWATKAGSAGRAFAGVSLRVVDPAGTELPADQVGHLEVRTRQAADADGWVRTSDLARLDDDGFVWITGRADDAIVRGGFKVHPATVVAVLERHPAVREAAVAGMPDERLGAVPVAAVELEAGAQAPTEDELRALCREYLTPYEVPAHVVVLDALPRTPSTKVSRVELLEQILARLVPEEVAS